MKSYLERVRCGKWADMPETKRLREFVKRDIELRIAELDKNKLGRNWMIRIYAEIESDQWILAAIERLEKEEK
jgi:hypothetical protein